MARSYLFAPRRLLVALLALGIPAFSVQTPSSDNLNYTKDQLILTGEAAASDYSQNDWLGAVIDNYQPDVDNRDEGSLMAEQNRRNRTVGKYGRRQAEKLVTCPPEASRNGRLNAGARISVRLPRSESDAEMRESSNGKWSMRAIDQWVSRGYLNLQRPTLLYTHGWRQRGTNFWLQKIRENYDNIQRQQGPRFNLLIFDWDEYANEPYAVSVTYVPYLGRLVASFFEHLRDKHNYNMSLVHFVAFSLSTHIVGQAGRQLAKKQPIGQITALDPTGVCFHEESSSIGEKIGLAPDDAQVVLARHYNMFALGAKRPIGGVDIIVNDGKLQPPMTRGFAFGGGWIADMLGIRSHLRASIHEIEPFMSQSDCHEVAYKCASREDFLAGQCGLCGASNESCHVLNTFANIQVRGNATPGVNIARGTQLFVNTGKRKFCLYTYQVIARLKSKAPPEAASAMEAGEFSFRLRGDSRLEVRPTHRKKRSLRFTQLLELQKKLDDFEDNIKLSPSEERWLDWLSSVQIKFLSHSSSAVRRKNSVAYCPDLKSRRGLTRCRRA